MSLKYVEYPNLCIAVIPQLYILYAKISLMLVKKWKKWTNDGHYVHDCGKRRMTESNMRHRNVFFNVNYSNERWTWLQTFILAGSHRDLGYLKDSSTRRGHGYRLYHEASF